MKNFLLLISLVAASCAPMHYYNLPISPYEADAFMPAVLSAAQSEGLRAWRTREGAVIAELDDGTMLSWQDSANHQEFILVVTLGTKPPDTAGRVAGFEAARQRADSIWQHALQLRTQMLGHP